VAGSANEKRVRRYWIEVWSKGNVEAVRDFYAPVFELNGEETSVEDFVRNARSWLDHFTDFSVEIQQVFECGPAFVSRVIYHATHTADFKTVPAQGKRVELSGIDIFEFREERVIRHWHEADHSAMFRQLGTEPQPVAA
jgi:steroid delta-isomerase-like uncharacterized protein